MHDKKEDDLQWEWCKDWTTNHKLKKLVRHYHWNNCKLFLQYAWCEFVSIFKNVYL